VGQVGRGWGGWGEFSKKGSRRGHFLPRRGMSAEPGIEMQDLALPTAKRKRGTPGGKAASRGKPDFTAARYGRLVAIMAVGDVGALADLSLRSFQEKAVALCMASGDKSKKPGSFNSYEKAIESILSNADAAATPMELEPATMERVEPEAAAGDEPAEQVDGGDSFAEAVAAVQELLDGQADGAEVLDESMLLKFESSLAAAAAELEVKLMEKLHGMSESQTVRDIQDVMHVSRGPLSHSPYAPERRPDPPPPPMPDYHLPSVRFHSPLCVCYADTTSTSIICKRDISRCRRCRPAYRRP
jgi:hypothetical protein